MSRIRMIHQLRGSTCTGDELATYARQLRDTPGVEESEAYGALDDPAHMALVQLWESQAAFNTYWQKMVGEANDLVVHEAFDGHLRSEFYPHGYFHRDRVWVANEHKESAPAIIWPASGGVRIVLQISVGDSKAAKQGFNADTRRTIREPGCSEYGWFQSIEFDEDFLLLELWESQFIYDNHWNLRIKTGSAGGGANEFPRATGTNGIEFYHMQEFIQLYDRWLPADPSTWSETIVWPY